MAISKVIFNGDTLMDVTGDNPASDNMLTGTKATGANGQSVNGALVTAPASDTSPAMDGTASAGSASTYSRGDHVHPSDTSKQAKITASGILKGDGSGGVTAATSGADYAAASHAHGNITSGGDITATAPTIASGDQIVINDNSASKITNGPTFDGSTTTKALTQKGTWETFLQSYTETDPTVPSWAKASSKPTYTASEVGALPDTTTIPSATSTSPKMDGTAAVGSESTFAKGDHVHPTDTSRQAKITASGILKGDGSGGVTAATSGTDYAAASHAHGNITSGGDITATAPTIANGDQIIINDNSASKITNGPTFDGSTTTKALTPKGTWETFLQSYTETDPTVPSWAKQSTKPSYTASEVGALPDSTTIPTASTTNPSMDGTASYGSGTSYARSNHVHPTDTTRAPLASPGLTGIPTAPTAASGTNTTQIATTAFVQTELNEVKTSVSNGKSAIASAITDKGVSTSSSDSFATMAENIEAIETADDIEIQNGTSEDYYAFKDNLSAGTFCNIYERIYPEILSYSSGSGRIYNLTNDVFIQISTVYADGFTYRLFTLNNNGTKTYLNNSTVVGGTTARAVSSYNLNWYDRNVIRYEATDTYFFYDTFGNSDDGTSFCIFKFTYSENATSITLKNSIESTSTNTALFATGSSSYNYSDTPVGVSAMTTDYLLFFKTYYKGSDNKTNTRKVGVYLPDSGTAAIGGGTQGSAKMPTATTYEYVIHIRRKSATEFYCFYSSGSSNRLYLCIGTITSSLDGTNPTITLSNNLQTPLYNIYSYFAGNSIIVDNELIFAVGRCYSTALSNTSTDMGFVVISLSNYSVVTSLILAMTVPDTRHDLIPSQVSTYLLKPFSKLSLINMNNNNYMILLPYSLRTSGSSSVEYNTIIRGFTFNYSDSTINEYTNHNAIFNNHNNMSSSETGTYTALKKLDNSSVCLVGNTSVTPSLKIYLTDWQESVYESGSTTDGLLLSGATRTKKGKLAVFTPST